MKKNILLTLLFSVVYAAAQTTNSFALWTSGGYNNFLSNVENIKRIGGIGGNLGIGYDLRKNGFLMQTGVEYQHYTSNAKITNFTENIQMRNSEGDVYDGIFIFENNRDRQTMGNSAAVLKLGFITSSNFYMLFGGKYAYNIYGSAKTYTKAISKAYYDHLIGEDDNGIFSDMPNHGYYTKKRILKEKFAFQPIFFGSVEAGLQIDGKKLLGATWRIAFFCDFGFTALKTKPLLYTSRIKDISITEEFKPAVRPFAFNHTIDRINPLFTGVKLTLLWGNEIQNNRKCKCIQEVNKKYKTKILLMR
jgi:hypothetical protein